MSSNKLGRGLRLIANVVLEFNGEEVHIYMIGSLKNLHFASTSKSLPAGLAQNVIYPVFTCDELAVAG